MPHTTHLGTAVSRPGSIQYRQWNAFTHATGHVEFLSQTAPFAFQ